MSDFERASRRAKSTPEPALSDLKPVGADVPPELSSAAFVPWPLPPIGHADSLHTVSGQQPPVAPPLSRSGSLEM